MLFQFLKAGTNARFEQKNHKFKKNSLCETKCSRLCSKNQNTCVSYSDSNLAKGWSIAQQLYWVAKSNFTQVGCKDEPEVYQPFNEASGLCKMFEILAVSQNAVCF